MRTLHANVFLMLTVASCWTLAAQEQAPSATSSQPGISATVAPGPNGVVSGIVICSDTHKPARGAQVVLLMMPKPGEPLDPDQPGYSMVASLEGTYRFEHVAPGKYLLSADLYGYLSDQRENYRQATSSASGSSSAKPMIADQFSRTITVTRDAVISAELTLQRGAALSGHVFFSDGSPAVDAAILIENADARPPRRVITQASGNQTDDNGHFRIAGLPKGRYVVSVAPRFSAAIVLWLSPHAFTTTIYSPREFHQRDAKVYEVKAGEEVEDVDITVPLALLHRIAGQVTAKDGRVLNMGNVTLTDTGDPAFSFTTNIEEDGTFSFSNIPSGTYKATIGDAFIGLHQKDAGDAAGGNASWTPIQAFADASITVLLGDSDVTDLAIGADEAPMPRTKN